MAQITIHISSDLAMAMIRRGPLHIMPEWLYYAVRDACAAAAEDQPTPEEQDRLLQALTAAVLSLHGTNATITDHLRRATAFHDWLIGNDE